MFTPLKSNWYKFKVKIFEGDQYYDTLESTVSADSIEEIKYSPGGYNPERFNFRDWEIEDLGPVSQKDIDFSEAQINDFRSAIDGKLD